MYIYEGHLGGLYASDELIPIDHLYCEQCGDSDWEIGNFDTFAEFLAYYADNITADDGHGGFYLDYVIEEIGSMFDDTLTYDEAKAIVLNNRTTEEYDDE